MVLNAEQLILTQMKVAQPMSIWLLQKHHSSIQMEYLVTQGNYAIIY
jgi:hypothetical protein